MGKLYNLDNYRKGVRETNETPGPPFTFIIEGKAGEAVIDAAQKENITPHELMARALSFVIEDTNLREEGYQGPIYKKLPKRIGRFGKWLVRIGFSGQEQIILRYNKSNSGDQAE